MKTEECKEKALQILKEIVCNEYLTLGAIKYKMFDLYDILNQLETEKPRRRRLP